jgi:hypothetical protein
MLATGRKWFPKKVIDLACRFSSGLRYGGLCTESLLRVESASAIVDKTSSHHLGSLDFTNPPISQAFSD